MFWTPRARLFAAALVAAASSGCATTTDTGSVSAAVTTRVTVDPVNFLGAVACGTQPGQMGSYVATLTDVTGPDAPFDLPSSAPTPCSQPVAFFYVRAGHQYTARVDGYEDGAPGLAPCDGPSSGSPHLMPASTCLPPASCHDALASGTIVKPRWTGRCGAPSVTASADDEVVMRQCDPLDESKAPLASPPVIELAPRDALGMLQCGLNDASQIAYFRIRVEGAKVPLPSDKRYDCATVETLVFQNPKPLETYTFVVEGVAARADRVKSGRLQPDVYRATCSVDAEPGFTRRACCNPLALVSP